MSKLRFGIVVFPGSNCDHDALTVCQSLPNAEARLLWHKNTDLEGSDVIILPGGFSFGDYLRPGAIARVSPIMQEVVRHAKLGKPVLGICNGFQILCEAGLLPGVLLRNIHRRFVCKMVHLKVLDNQSIFMGDYQVGEVLRMPIAHGDGNYFAPPEVLDELEANGQVVLKYCDATGNITDAANPNGAARNIAGILNREKNVMGLMPHPERAAEALLGSTDGRRLFESLVQRAVVQAM
ncbi:MAG: phosphoribosylformylglycinamidine synthase subunit PurQ [Chloroherpetonaceae bacterium]|nr:phosphoribosylformylglycinamidine synthase subunit PurQ [Chloroherpetonaceae bacterium]